MGRRWLLILWHWGPAAAYLAAIFTVSSLHALPVDYRKVLWSDKIAHGLAYGLLCVLLFRGFRMSCRPWVFRWAPLLALAVSSLYGVTDEFHQHFVPGRSCDPGDWLADTIGAALAAAVLMVYTEIRRYPTAKRCD